MADQGLQYLKIDTQEAFDALEQLISGGYSQYRQISQEVGEGGYKDQKNPAPDALIENWQKSCDNWRNGVAEILTTTFVSTNYADEFILANLGGGMRVSTGPISDMRQNLLGNIRKLEQYRDRLLSKSSLVINNSGHFNFQTGSHNLNEQGTQQHTNR